MNPPYADEYYSNPDATKESFTQDGWFKTGDVGILDEEDYLYIVDRKSDMVKSGGINIYPREIENILINHPKISEVAVIGVSDDKWGEAIKAVVYLKPEEKAAQEEMKAFCEGRMARIKIPKTFDFVEDPLPRSSTGKILKRVIRGEYWGKEEKKIH